MLNLSEQWKQAYAEYLEEQDAKLFDDIDIVCEELTTAHAEITKSYSLLESYCRTLLEFDLTDDRPGDDGDRGITVKITPGSNNKNRESKTSENITDLMKQLIDLGGQAIPNGMDKNDFYEPAVTYTTQKITDMKFPQNFLFFIGQFIKWLRNIVIFFIEKFKNLLRRLVGAEPVEVDYNALKFDLQKVKKIEQVSTSVDLGKGKDNVVKAWTIKPDQINLLEGGETFAQFLGITKKKEEEPVKTQRVIVTVDLSRDIMALKELMQHFYDLFDEAYGSNNEKLFASDDLKLILDMFKDSIERIKTGDEAYYSINGNAVAAGSISKDRVKQNLITTNSNIEALKQAYMQTSAKIQDITKIINSKEMMMLTDMGVDFRLLTSSTYEQLKKILDTMPSRFKETAKMEKDLTKVQKQYEKIIQELNGMQRNIASVSNITYDNVYNRKLIDLLTAANWMSQTVTLRLAGLGLYIRELKDVRDAIVMLSKTNKGSSAEKKLYKF